MKIDKMRVEVNNVTWEAGYKEISVKVIADGKKYGTMTIASEDDLESMFEFMWRVMGDKLLDYMKADMKKACIECNNTVFDQDGYCLGCGRKN